MMGWSPSKRVWIIALALARPLYAEPAGNREAIARNLQAAEAAHAASPEDLDAAIWHGRRLGYAFRMREAIAVYTDALRRWPDEPRLLRHRGHRYISIRRFDDAIRDLSRAAALTESQPDEIEPDGLPNAANIPLTTLKFNIWYHLALAHYLKGDFAKADEAWQRTATFAGEHDDNVCAVHYWRDLTLRKLGRDAEAAALLQPIRFDMKLLENHAYHMCLMLFKGAVRPEEVIGVTPPKGTARPAAVLSTAGYGVGMWLWQQGFREEAIKLWHETARRGSWPSFGAIAAEVELSRMR
jgi:tetratricopeptide (TPR) repeat protein